MSEYIQTRSKLEHRRLAKGREGLGNKLKSVTQAGKRFARGAKTAGADIKRGIR